MFIEITNTRDRNELLETKLLDDISSSIGEFGVTIVCVALRTEFGVKFFDMLRDLGQCNNVILLETGPGNLNSYQSLDRVLSIIEESQNDFGINMNGDHFDIVNIGTCCAIGPRWYSVSTNNDPYPTGKIVKPVIVRSLLPNIGLYEAPVYELNGIGKSKDLRPELLSVDFFVQAPSVQHYYEIFRTDIIDMECYGLCKAAQHWLKDFQTNMRCFKVVSDKGEVTPREWNDRVLLDKEIHEAFEKIVEDNLL